MSLEFSLIFEFNLTIFARVFSIYLMRLLMMKCALPYPSWFLPSDLLVLLSRVIVKTLLIMWGWSTTLTHSSPFACSTYELAAPAHTTACICRRQVLVHHAPATNSYCYNPSVMGTQMRSEREPHIVSIFSPRASHWLLQETGFVCILWLCMKCGIAVRGYLHFMSNASCLPE